MVGGIDARHSNDDEKWVNNEDLSITIVNLIEDLGVSNITGPLVGLGAGGGDAEIGLARRLGIQDITLVDKDHENIEGFAGHYIESDLFEFLENNTNEKYGAVTLFGLEYVLGKRLNWTRLWNGVKNITRKDSIVMISPHTGFKIGDESFDVKYDNKIMIAQRTT